jgi:hypothetical protein
MGIFGQASHVCKQAHGAAWQPWGRYGERGAGMATARADLATVRAGVASVGQAWRAWGGHGDREGRHYDTRCAVDAYIVVAGLAPAMLAHPPSLQKKDTHSHFWASVACLQTGSRSSMATVGAGMASVGVGMATARVATTLLSVCHSCVYRSGGRKVRRTRLRPLCSLSRKTTHFIDR